MCGDCLEKQKNQKNQENQKSQEKQKPQEIGSFYKSIEKKERSGPKNQIIDVEEHHEDVYLQCFYESFRKSAIDTNNYNDNELYEYIKDLIINKKIYYQNFFKSRRLPSHLYLGSNTNFFEIFTMNKYIKSFVEKKGKINVMVCGDVASMMTNAIMYNVNNEEKNNVYILDKELNLKSKALEELRKKNKVTTLKCYGTNRRYLDYIPDNSLDFIYFDLEPHDEITVPTFNLLKPKMAEKCVVVFSCVNMWGIVGHYTFLGDMYRLGFKQMILDFASYRQYICIGNQTYSGMINNFVLLLDKNLTNSEFQNTYGANFRSNGENEDKYRSFKIYNEYLDPETFGIEAMSFFRGPAELLNY